MIDMPSRRESSVEFGENMLFSTSFHEFLDRDDLVSHLAYYPVEVIYDDGSREYHKGNTLRFKICTSQRAEELDGNSVFVSSFNIGFRHINHDAMDFFDECYPELAQSSKFWGDAYVIDDTIYVLIDNENGQFLKPIEGKNKYSDNIRIAKLGGAMRIVSKHGRTCKSATRTADWSDNLFNIVGEDCDGVVEIHMDDSGNIEGYEVEVECYGDEGDDVINFYQQCFFPVTSLTDLAVEIASDCQAEYGGDLDIDTNALADEFRRHLNAPLSGLFASRRRIASGLVSEKIVPVGGTDWKIKFTLDYMGRDTLRIMNSEGWMTEILMDDSDWGYAYWLDHLADDVYEECLGGWFGYDAEDEMMWFRDDILDALFQIGDWELNEYRRLEEEAYGKESSKTAGGGPFPELSWFERSENVFGDERWEYQFEDYLIVFGQDMHGVVGDGRWDWEVSRANMRSDLMLQSWDKFDTLEEAYEDFRAVVFHEKDEPKSNLWFDDMRGTDLVFGSKSASRTFTYAEQEELQDESIGTLCRNHAKLKGHEDSGDTVESMFV